MEKIKFGVVEFRVDRIHSIRRVSHYIAEIRFKTDESIHVICGTSVLDNRTPDVNTEVAERNCQLSGRVAAQPCQLLVICVVTTDMGDCFKPILTANDKKGVLYEDVRCESKMRRVYLRCFLNNL